MAQIPSPSTQCGQDPGEGPGPWLGLTQDYSLYLWSELAAEISLYHFASQINKNE